MVNNFSSCIQWCNLRALCLMPVFSRTNPIQKTRTIKKKAGIYIFSRCRSQFECIQINSRKILIQFATNLELVFLIFRLVSKEIVKLFFTLWPQNQQKIRTDFFILILKCINNHSKKNWVTYIWISCRFYEVCNSDMALSGLMFSLSLLLQHWLMFD